jgi:hypothetical protein
MAIAEVPDQLVGVQVSPKHHNHVIVTNNGGGLINHFWDQAVEWHYKDIKTEIRGVCNSACLMYTFDPNTCVYENVLFGFHQANYQDPKLTEEQRQKEEANSTHFMITHMNKHLQDYVNQNISKLPTWKSGQLLVLSSNTVIKNGWIPKCQDKVSLKFMPSHEYHRQDGYR